MSKLRNILIGAGVAAVGGIGTKVAVDYFRNRGKEEEVPELEAAKEDETITEAVASAEMVAYANVADRSVQEFLDASFGDVGRYVPTRTPKIFDHLDQQYMVIWAHDNEQAKNQMLAFKYVGDERQMIASVGYTPETTDYNLYSLSETPFAVEVNGEQITSGEGETAGTEEVDFVLAGA